MNKSDFKIINPNKDDISMLSPIRQLNTAGERIKMIEQGVMAKDYSVSRPL